MGNKCLESSVNKMKKVVGFILCGIMFMNILSGCSHLFKKDEKYVLETMDAISTEIDKCINDLGYTTHLNFKKLVPLSGQSTKCVSARYDTDNGYIVLIMDYKTHEIYSVTVDESKSIDTTNMNFMFEYWTDLLEIKVDYDFDQLAFYNYYSSDEYDILYEDSETEKSFGISNKNF